MVNRLGRRDAGAAPPNSGRSSGRRRLSPLLSAAVIARRDKFRFQSESSARDRDISAACDSFERQQKRWKRFNGETHARINNNNQLMSIVWPKSGRTREKRTKIAYYRADCERRPTVSKWPAIKEPRGTEAATQSAKANSDRQTSRETVPQRAMQIIMK